MRNKLPISGFCSKCGNYGKYTSRIERMCSPCYHRRWRLSHPENVKISQDKYTRTHIEVRRQNNRSWRRNNPEKYKAQKRRSGLRRRTRLRLKVLKYYSNGFMKCGCCSESIERFLTIDAILFAGHKKITQSGYMLNWWLNKHNFPDGYRVLCFNCNCGRDLNNGMCPHVGPVIKSKWYEDIRNEVISYYSKGTMKCECCEEKIERFLTIDSMLFRSHKKVTGSGNRFYRWLKKNNYPNGYQVLCFNCNSGREANGGICPHQEANNATST